MLPYARFFLDGTCTKAVVIFNPPASVSHNHCDCSPYEHIGQYEYAPVALYGNGMIATPDYGILLPAQDASNKGAVEALRVRGHVGHQVQSAAGISYSLFGLLILPTTADGRATT